MVPLFTPGTLRSLDRFNCLRLTPSRPSVWVERIVEQWSSEVVWCSVQVSSRDTPPLFPPDPYVEYSFCLLSNPSYRLFLN